MQPPYPGQSWESHSFAPLRVCVCVYLLRSTSGDSLQTIVPFFLLGLGWGWVCQEEKTVDSVAFAFIISGVPRVFVVLSESSTLCLPLQVSFCAPARVYNFSCFTAVVRCAAPLQPPPHPCSAQLFSAFFFHALLASFSSSFFVAVHLIFKRNLLLPSATVSPSPSPTPSPCPLCLCLLPLAPLAQPCCGQFRK